MEVFTADTNNGQDLRGFSAGSNGESNLQEIIAASGISPRLWRLYACFWLVCLFFPVLDLVQVPPTGPKLAVAIAALAAFTVTYIRVIWPHPLNASARTRFKLWKSILLLCSLTLMVLILCRVYGNTFLWLLIGVSAISGITLPFRQAAAAVTSLTLLTLGISIGLGGGLTSIDWVLIIPLALLVRGLGLDMIGFMRLSDALRQLQSAREEIARQAVTEERLRMARDLHDLLGHTLSLITLKSELAGRLLEKDAGAATQEIHEVERVARQALREVREAVAGFRQLSLRGELDGARQIVEAAGMVCEIEYEEFPLPSNVEMVLGWVVREGVTNVIRHSRAQRCWIRVARFKGNASVEVANDGYAGEQSQAGRTGSGLSGLTERVLKQGGHLEAGPQMIQDATGFRLRAEIPIEEPIPAEAG